MKRFFFALLILLSLVLTPFLVSAQEQGLVPCGGAKQSPCTLCHLFQLFQNILNFTMKIIFPITIVMLIYGGFFMMTTASSDRVQKGKTIMTNAIIGLVIVLSAWLILNSVFQVLAIGADFSQVDIRVWNSIQCTPGRGYTPPTSSATPSAGTPSAPSTPSLPSVQPGQLSSADARNILMDNGIAINKAECAPSASGAYVSGCTSLQGVRASVIEGTIDLKKNCNCNITVTGGTEGGHAGGTYSHANGYKVDYRPNAQLDSYIQNNYQQIGTRSDGAMQYKAPNGAVYAREGDHWDVVYR